MPRVHRLPRKWLPISIAISDSILEPPAVHSDRPEFTVRLPVRWSAALGQLRRSERGRALHVADTRHFFSPFGPNCLTYVQRFLTSCSFLIPGNTILVPGIFPRGSLMYSVKVTSPQTIAAFLLASL